MTLLGPLHECDYRRHSTRGRPPRYRFKHGAGSRPIRADAAPASTQQCGRRKSRCSYSSRASAGRPELRRRLPRAGTNARQAALAVGVAAQRRACLETGRCATAQLGGAAPSRGTPGLPTTVPFRGAAQARAIGHVFARRLVIRSLRGETAALRGAGSPAWPEASRWGPHGIRPLRTPEARPTAAFRGWELSPQ